MKFSERSLKASSESQQWIWFKLNNVLFWCILLFASAAQAQIVPDDTLGQERSRLVPFPGADLIQGGAVRGANLFHSFSEFNVGDGALVYFGNPTGIQNILTRVTGKNASTISGVLGVDGRANLFLLNPNGIIFGRNAVLDVRGSFVGSTATAIGFGSQGNFSAINPQAPALLTVQPSALLFSQAQAGQIDVRSQLSVPESQNLLLVGGNVNLQQAQLTAPGGQIELAGIAKPGTIDLNGFQLEFSNQTPRANITIDQSRVSTTGTTGGNIRFNANDIDIKNQSLIETGTETTINAPPARSGDVAINATGTVSIAQQSNLFANAAFGTTERPGAITINARSLNLADKSNIQTIALGLGQAGDVTLNVQDALTLTNGSTAGSLLLLTQAGQAGNLNINTGSLLIENGSFLGSLPIFAIGNAGNINIQARDRIVLRGKDADGTPSSILSPPAFSQGKGGDINIQTGSLQLDPETQIVSGTVGEGDAGNITIDARNDVVFDGGQANSSVGQDATGKGGDIRIQAESIRLLNGGGLFALSSGNGSAGNIQVNTRKDITIRGRNLETASGIVTALILNPNNLAAPGRGGDIAITADNIFLSEEGSIITGNLGRPGNSGALSIKVRDRLNLSSNSNISTYTFGQGNAGQLSIDAGNSVSLDQNSGILTSSFSFPAAFEFLGVLGFSREQLAASSGVNLAEFNRVLGLFSPTAGASNNLEIRTGLLRLSGGSTIATGTGSGDGGDIRLQLDRGLILRSQGRIVTNAGVFEQAGNGGNITIESPFIVAVPREQSLISASAFSGRGGNITINTTGLYGIEPRATTTIPSFRTLQTPISSEITASSQLGVQGNINIVRPEVEPTQSTIELPTAPIPGNQISQICRPQGNADRSIGSFVNSGRGSAPPSPIDPLTGSVSTPLATLEGAPVNRSAADGTVKNSPAIVEAQSWIKTADGKVMLVARTPETTPQTVAACPR